MINKYITKPLGLAALATTVCLSSAAAVDAADVTLNFDVDDSAGTFDVYLDISDPENETLGLATAYFDIYGTGDVVVESVESKLPTTVDAGPGGTGTFVQKGFYLIPVNQPNETGTGFSVGDTQDIVRRQAYNGDDLIINIGEATQTEESFYFPPATFPYIPGLGTLVASGTFSAGETGGTLVADEYFDESALISGIFLFPPELPDAFGEVDGVFEAHNPDSVTRAEYTVVIPEPTSIGLLAGAGLLGLRRRR